MMDAPATARCRSSTAPWNVRWHVDPQRAVRIARPIERPWRSHTFRESWAPKKPTQKLDVFLGAGRKFFPLSETARGTPRLSFRQSVAPNPPLGIDKPIKTKTTVTFFGSARRIFVSNWRSLSLDLQNSGQKSWGTGPPQKWWGWEPLECCAVAAAPAAAKGQTHGWAPKIQAPKLQSFTQSTDFFGRKFPKEKWSSSAQFKYVK